MDFFIIWLLVLCANLIVWIIWSRCNRLRDYLDHIVVIRRSTRKESCSSRPLLSIGGLISNFVFRPVRSRLISLYLEDDKNVTGFNPARTLRTLIIIGIAAQNVAAMAIIRDNGVREAFSRSGKLACANMLPLVLLAFPDLGIARLVGQPSPQIVWAHTFLGWIIWYEVLLHVGLSVFYLSGPRKHYNMIYSWHEVSDRHRCRNNLAIGWGCCCKYNFLFLSAAGYADSHLHRLELSFMPLYFMQPINST